jgi:hypothetical protein
MKQKFTFLMAAVMLLLNLLVLPGKAVGQTRSTAGFNLSAGGTVPVAVNETTGTISGTNETWNVTITNNAYSAFTGTTNNRYWQMGKGNSAITSAVFSTSGVSGTITSIVVKCATGSGGGSLSATVGGSAFGTQNQSLPTWSNNAGSDVTFTGSASGAIVITEVPNTGKACYIQSITVTYTPSSSPVDPTITFNDGSVYVGNTLDLSSLFTSNSTGAVTYSITEGGSYASLAGSEITGTAVGSVTVQASQAATAAYNAATATATITVNAVPTLSSIAITTPPTKTTYFEGEIFDPAGMVVTATYSDSNTNDVTSLCTYTPSVALTTSDIEITVSYTEGGVTKTATQSITVNEYVQPTEFDINLNDSFFGTNYGGSASGITDSNPVVGTKDNVTVTYAGSGNHYINSSQIRFYPNNKLTFDAPTGYMIKKIVFTSGGTWTATISANAGTYTTGTKTWEGEAASVLFTGSGSGQCQISKAAITLERQKVLSSISADVTGATTVFHVGDAFTHEGVVVTAHYDDESTANVTNDAVFSSPDMSSAGEKTVTVSYTENNVEKTTSYNITVNAPATLESITLSGDYPTVFTQFDVFSSEGIVVTANFDDETSSNVTSEATFSGYNMSTVGAQTVTVSYGGKTATYGITVNAYVQPTSIAANLNNTTFGVDTGNNGDDQSYEVDNVTIVAGCLSNAQNDTYYDSNHVRFYDKSYLKMTAPTGYNITKIVFTANGTWNGSISVNVGEYDNSNKTWEGETSQLDFSFAAQNRIASAAITLERQKVLSSISLSGDYPTTFPVDATFSHSGMIVTATYDDESTKDVTANATFNGYDMSTDGEQTVTVSYTENNVTKTTTYDITVIVPATLTSISLSGTYPTVFDKGDAFSSEGIVVTAHYDDESSMNVTEDATFSGYNMSTVGEQTVTVSYSDKTATYNITVLQTGIASNPYTVAQALANTPSSGTSANVYIHGVVSGFFKTNITGDGSNYRYYISDDGTTTNQLLVYKGKGLDNVTFSDADDLLVGDIVTIYGGLTTYQSTKEIASDNYIINMVRPGAGSDPAAIAGTVVDFTIANDDNYIVASNTTLTVTGTLTNNGTAANLIIEDGGQLILHNSGVQATVRKTTAASSAKVTSAWNAISSSVDYVEISKFIKDESDEQNQHNVYRYDEATVYWQEYRYTSNAFTNLTNGRGYLYRSLISGVEFAGDVNVGNIDCSDFLSWSCDEYGGRYKGFNLIGNPFTHNITWSNIIDKNYISGDGYYTLESDGTWNTQTTDGTIAPMQAFLIQAIGASPALKIANVAPVKGDDDRFGGDQIMFNVENSEYSDVAYVLFKKGHGLNKIEHRNDKTPMLYIINEDGDYAIADMPDNTSVINLGFEAKTMGEYTISLKVKGQYSYMHLFDKLTGDDVDMLVEDSYTFIGSQSDRKDRFVLRLNYNAANIDNESDIFAYQSGSDIIISGEGELQIFDITGRKVMTTAINGVEAINGLNNGVYIFKLEGKTQKIVVR